MYILPVFIRGAKQRRPGRGFRSDVVRGSGSARNRNCGPYLRNYQPGLKLEPFTSALKRFENKTENRLALD
jgi:hypothetical protein